MLNKYKDIFAVLARIIVGGVFIFAGWYKVSHIADTVAGLGTMGIPAFITYLVAYGEFLGGIAVVLGLWTEIALAGLVIIMIGAVYFTKGKDMSAIATLGGVFGLLASGAGKFALSSFCMKKKDGAMM
jgi:putative oxidoreductase